MAEVGTAIVAGDFGADHPDAAVGVFINQAGFIWRMKTGPATTGIKLGFRTKEWSATADAAIGSIVVAIPILSGKSTLSAFLSGDTILGFVKLATPLGVGFFDFWHVGFLEDYDSDRCCRK